MLVKVWLATGCWGWTQADAAASRRDRVSLGLGGGEWMGCSLGEASCAFAEAEGERTPQTTGPLDMGGGGPETQTWMWEKRTSSGSPISLGDESWNEAKRGLRRA